MSERLDPPEPGRVLDLGQRSDDAYDADVPAPDRDTAAILAYAKTTPHVHDMIAEVLNRRFTRSPEDIERLIWLIAAQAVCHGARGVLNGQMFSTFGV